MNNTLVSMALYDPDGILAPFVKRTIGEVCARDVTFVAHATHPLTDEDAAWVRSHGELIERDNVGLDLYGHRLVLESHAASDFDEVIITNDTFVLLKPLSDIEQGIKKDADFWGLTSSTERGRHIQSYFVDFRRRAVKDPAFMRHWSSVEPMERKATIIHNEVGLSRTLARAGLTMDAAYHPTLSDRLLAERRALRHGWHNPRSILGQWNTNAILPDAALRGTLPSVKISTLRYDPFHVGADGLLDDLEGAFPDRMDGVRQYLERTRSAYAA